MNKAITDGVDLMPRRFGEGLDVWSNQDGTPGSTTYDGQCTAAIVPSDSDFGTCLELLKTDNTQKLRYMLETPLLPGCYLQVTARIKAVSGNLPTVRIAGWAGNTNGHVNGLVETGPATTLTSYGEVVEIRAIIGAGNRGGVDMVWGTGPVFGHFGLDLTGHNGGIVRIEDIRIEDATSVFLRNMMDWVDVRDYGAIGDGVTDDSAAFEAADTAAGGRTVLVSEGVYHLANHVTFESRVRFEGTVTMPVDIRLSLTRNFDFPSYVDAFGNEELALKKALQALFNFTDHDSLDLCGRRIQLSEPLDVHAAVNNRDTYSNRRVLRNGELESDGSASWDTEVYTALASYSASQPTKLGNVAGISQIPVGSLVEGVGVGREVYVRSKNVPAGTIELSLPLYGAPGQQVYTFKRFKYLLDFSGFTYVQRFNVADVEFLCMGNCSALMIPSDGLAFQVRDCFITTPKDRGITSIGHGCAGLTLDRNQFLSNEQATDIGDRVSIAFNVNSNDAKIRDNRAVRFKHFGVLAGTGHMILSNHFFQGDNAQTDERTAGIVLSSTNCMTILGGNYVDNCSIDWTNEHDATPDDQNGFSFGGLTVDGNIFYGSHAPAWFSFLRIKPCGSGHYINGLHVSGNTFRHSGGSLERVDRVDDSIAPLDPVKFLNIRFEGNTYNNIDNRTFNPATVEIDQNVVAQTWDGDFTGLLPFGGKTRKVVGVMAHNQIQNAANGGIYTMPYSVPGLGNGGEIIRLHWSEPVKGKVYVTAQADNLG
ncbi:MAG: right-handed parallel beta-helix repeat-containing protein [Rhodobacteraceae bacterium]|nr:right-handed parallel beta-helix repeat-containing protein [Paracoccaceae bacterium]